MLSPTQERVVRSFVRATDRFYAMVGRADENPRLKDAMLRRSVELRCERRGEERRAWNDDGQPIDLWIPLAQAVAIEMRRRRPEIVVGVVADRRRRRLAVGCGYVQLALSDVAAARRRMREIIFHSGLAVREVAEALGVDVSTLDRHLNGHRPSRRRLAFYRRVLAISASDQEILIAVRRTPRTRKKFGWRTTLEAFMGGDDEDS